VKRLRHARLTGMVALEAEPSALILAKYSYECHDPRQQFYD